MRVAMVTPMAPESAIADVMMQAVPFLSEHWELEVWCPTESAYRPCPVTLHPFERPERAVIESLSGFDLVVHVLGNSPWHARILPLVRQVPGLVVLHDVVLTDLVREVAVQTETLGVLSRQIRVHHGQSHADRVLAGARAGQAGWLETCAEVPLVALAIEGSLGAVVHSHWHRRSVEGLTLGEVTVAPLPVPSGRVGFTEVDDGVVDALLADLPADSVLVVTIGAVNANRRIDLLLDVMSGLDDGGRVHLWALGPAEPVVRAELLRTAALRGLSGRFAAPGPVGDDQLGRVLARADVGVAIREPVLEGQSASLLTQMAAGLPVLVFDHAHYAEMPDDGVVKIDPSDPIRGLSDAMEVLVADPEARGRVGAVARECVADTRSGKAYSAGLLAAGASARGVKPRSELIERVGAGLRRNGLHTQFAVVDRALDLVDALFEGPQAGVSGPHSARNSS